MSCDDPFGVSLHSQNHASEPVLALVPEPGGPVLGTGSEEDAEVTEPGPGGSEPGAEVVLADDLPGQQMTQGEQLRALTIQWLKQAWKGWRSKGGIAGMARDFWHFRPYSMAEHQEYVRSGKWRQHLPDSPGGAFVRRSGVAYGVGFARPAKVFLKSAEGIIDHPSRVLVVLLCVLLISLIVVFAV